MLAERADKIIRQNITLVNITAHLADKAFFALGLGLRLDIILIIIICHGLGVGYYARLGNKAYKHSVRVKVHILLNLERHKRIYISA